MGQGGRIAAVLTSLALLCMLAGCQGSNFIVGTTLGVIDLTGSYASTSEIGALGTLSLALERVEETRVFRAEVSGALIGDVEPSKGIGTLGDYHLILNFERGEKSDCYYEGTVQLSGETITAISGQFVFPDQAETLTVVFTPVAGAYSFPAST